MSDFDYIRDPGEIYRRSFEMVRAEADLGGMADDMAGVAVRIVHACGMPEVAAALRFGGDAVAAARAALAAGACILADCAMVADGIIRPRLPAANEVLCTLHGPGVRARARAARTTRSAAAVELWRPRLEGAVVAIGNAPTALFRLLEVLADGAPKPAAIIAFPVGFVGAAESKQALIDAGPGVPYITLPGRRGGSAMAAAAVNAIAGLDA